MAEEYSRDIVEIIIRGEEAKTTLRELRELFQGIQQQATQTGISIDEAMGKLIAPMESIARNTRATVTELQALRNALAGLGTGVAPLAQTSQAIRQIGISAQYTWQQLAAMQTGGPWSAATARGYQAYGAMPPYQAEWTAAATAAQQALAVAPVPMGAARTVEQTAVGLDTLTASTERLRTTTDRSRASFQRHIVWFVQGTIIYYALSTAIQAVSDQIEGLTDDIVAYDSALAQMRFITGDTTAQLNELAGAALSVGVAFGQMPTDVYPGLVQITQATKDYNEQLQLSADAAKWAFMSGQEYADGVDQLVAIERVWNMEAAEGQRILDAVATSYRVAMVPMDEMMSTMEKGGRIAESVGMDFEEYAAMIAAMGEYANLSAAQVTTLMESIAARPFRPEIGARFEREFGFLNIPIYEPGTAQTERRAIIDIINDIAQHWDDLSAKQRQSIAEIMAGQRYASEFLAFMEAWRHVGEYVGEYNDNLGESNELLDQQMQSLTAFKDRAVAAFRDARHEAGQYFTEISGIKTILDEVAVRLEAQARLARIARGEAPEPLTRAEQLRANIAQYEEELARIRGERGVLQEIQARSTQALLLAPFVGRHRAMMPEVQEANIEQMIAQWREQLAMVEPTGAGKDLMGEYKAALEETAQMQREIFSEQEAAAQRLAQIMAGDYIQNVDAWVAGLSGAASILDLSEMTQEQIVAAQEQSIAIAMAQYNAYIEIVKAEQDGIITKEQEIVLQGILLEQLQDEVVLIKNAKGEYEVIVGLKAAFLQEATRALEVERERFNIQRLGRVEPEQFGALQQAAWQWQAYLQTLPGYDEQAQQFFVVLADNVARPIVTTSTALRYAIEDLTEVEKRQLEGMWNLPAGVTAYVPITSLFYQQQGATGPPGAMPMAGPPGGLETLGQASDDLAMDFDYAGLAATTMGTAVNTLASAFNSLSSIIENLAQASILTPARAEEMERVFSTPWAETWEQVTSPSTTMTQAMRTETQRALSQPWDLQRALESVQAPPVKADITLTSNLYLNSQLLAQSMQQQMGVDLAEESRAFGTRAAGNAPAVMV